MFYKIWTIFKGKDGPKYFQPSINKELQITVLHKPKQIKENLPQPLCIDRRYYYKNPTKPYPSFFDLIKVFFHTQWERLLSFIGTYFPIKKLQKYHYFLHKENLHPNNIYETEFSADKKTNQICWLGHASCLIQTSLFHNHSSLCILTDPCENDLQKLFYPRQTKIAKKINELPHLPHIILITHNHPDHCDFKALKKIVFYQPFLIVPLGDKATFTKLGFHNVYELSWWDQITLNITKNSLSQTLSICAVPAKHWSGRTWQQRNRSLFNSYVIQMPHLPGDIYFAGDTAKLDDHLLDLLNDIFNIHFAIQPGGQEEKRKDLEDYHQCTADALLIHFKTMILNLYNKMFAHQTPSKQDKNLFFKKLQSYFTLIVHIKTFKLGNLHFDDAEKSFNNIIHALEMEKSTLSELTYYEQETLHALKQLREKILFDHQPISYKELADILTKTFYLPKKIGQIFPLASS